MVAAPDAAALFSPERRRGAESPRPPLRPERDLKALLAHRIHEGLAGGISAKSFDEIAAQELGPAGQA